MTALAYLRDTGDLILRDFDPTKGREPPLVSPAAFTRKRWPGNRLFDRVARCNLSTSVVLPLSLAVAGELVTGQIRGIDTHAGQSGMQALLCRTRSADCPIGTGEAQTRQHDWMI